MMEVRSRRTKRRPKAATWAFNTLTLRDIVHFRAGSFADGDRINSLEALRAARQFHGVGYLGRLKIEDDSAFHDWLATLVK